LEFLDLGLGGLQVSNDFNPFEIHDAYLLQNVEAGVHGAPLCNKSGKLNSARLDAVSESPNLPSAHLYSDYRKILVRRFNILL